MIRRYALPAFFLFCFSNLFGDTSGKITGIVTDATNGELIAGTNITVEGTSLGATSDLDGYFVILNVPAGLYIIRAQYIGYSDVLITDVRVYASTTANVNIQLQETAIELSEAIEIIGKRPLVEKNFTHSYAVVTSDEIETISIRGLDNILNMQAGVVVQDGEVHIRGGRSDQTGYYVDGSPITTPFDNARSLSVIQNAMEEMQVLTGGYQAEYGGAVSGIVLTELKTGKSDLQFSLEAQTDNFVDTGEKFLDTYSYGHSIITGTVGTPIYYDNVRFFGAVENEYIADWRKRSSSGFKFTNLVDTGPYSRTRGDTIAVLAYPDGYTPHNRLNTWKYNGTILFDLNPLQIRLKGVYTHQRMVDDQTPMVDLLNNRENLIDSQELLLGIKFVHTLDSRNFYTAQFNYFNYQYHDEDSYFGDNWRAWTDSALVAQYTNGRVIYNNRWGDYPPNALGNIELAGFPFAQDGDPAKWSYEESKRNYLSGRFDFTSQFNRYNELKAGFNFEYYTIRRFRVFPDEFMSIAERYGGEENIPYSEVMKGAVFGGITIGYDYQGREIDDDQLIELDGQTVTGPQGPAHPVFASGYLQDKLEFDDLIINAGLRFDYINTDSKQLIDPSNPPIIQTFKTIADSGWTDAKPVQQISPRLGISFPVSERTVFYAQYGKFMQMPELMTIFGNRAIYGNRIISGFFSYAGENLEPVRTTQYEVGFRHQFGDVSAISLVGYYKNIKNQTNTILVLANPLSEIRSYSTFQNQDFSTIRGFDFEFTLRRIDRLQAKLNLTVSSSEGSSSDAFDPITKDAFPLNYDQRYRGTLLLDYRFADQDGGPVLENLGMNLIFQFTSGHPYTAYDPLPGSASNGYAGAMILDSRSRSSTEPVNASLTPWTFTTDLRLDKNIRLMKSLWLNLYVRVNNLFNTQNVLNVYRTTGSADDDGWLANSDNTREYVNRFGQNYIDMYRTLNLKNGQAYLEYTGNELYSQPRQIWFGMKFIFGN
jgi:outer membrane receptor protein involved in Fe transport